MNQKTTSVFCTKRSLNPWCWQRGTDHLVPDCLCVMLLYVPSRTYASPSYDCKSGVETKFLILRKLLIGIVLNKKLTKRANAVNLFTKRVCWFKLMSHTKSASDWFFKQESIWMICVTFAGWGDADPFCIIECFQSRDQHLCKFIAPKDSVCFNS